LFQFPVYYNRRNYVIGSNTGSLETEYAGVTFIRFAFYHIIYFHSVDPYRITKSI